MTTGLAAGRDRRRIAAARNALTVRDFDRIRPSLAMIGRQLAFMTHAGIASANGGHVMVWIGRMASVIALVLMATIGGAAQGGPPADTARAATAMVNLNTATAAELERLPGVGPAIVARILEYRQKNSGFKKVEELMNVQGIGERSFLRLKTLVTVTQPRSAER